MQSARNHLLAAQAGDAEEKTEIVKENFIAFHRIIPILVHVAQVAAKWENSFTLRKKEYLFMI